MHVYTERNATYARPQYLGVGTLFTKKFTPTIRTLLNKVRRLTTYLKKLSITSYGG